MNNHIFLFSNRTLIENQSLKILNFCKIADAKDPGEKEISFDGVKKKLSDHKSFIEGY